MESSSRVALGIVAAAALLLVGYIAYSEFQRQRDIAEAQAALSAIGEQGRQLASSSRRIQYAASKRSASRWLCRGIAGC